MPPPAEKQDAVEGEAAAETDRNASPATAEGSVATAREFASSVMSYSSIGNDDGSYIGTLNAEDNMAANLAAVIEEDTGGYERAHEVT